MSKRANRLVGVVHSLKHASALECVHYNLLVLAAFAVEYELGNARLVSANLNALVYVAVCMTCNGDRLLPVAYCRMDARDSDRSTEYGTVEDRTYSAVRTLPHLMELILVHTLMVRRNGGALNSHTKTLCSLSCILCNLVAGLVTLYQTEVVIF